jgi:hypothetical protein
MALYLVPWVLGAPNVICVDTTSHVVTRYSDVVTPPDECEEVHHLAEAMPWLRHLVAGLSLQRAGLDSIIM